MVACVLGEEMRLVVGYGNGEGDCAALFVLQSRSSKVVCVCVCDGGCVISLVSYEYAHLL